jgi:hypothetical protein
MAIVAELSGNGVGNLGNTIDNKLGHVSRIVGAVHGSITPSYIGEIVTDIAADQNYVGKRADGDFDTDTLSTSDWAKTD